MVSDTWAQAHYGDYIFLPIQVWAVATCDQQMCDQMILYTCYKNDWHQRPSVNTKREGSRLLWFKIPFLPMWNTIRSSMILWYRTNIQVYFSQYSGNLVSQEGIYMDLRITHLPWWIFQISAINLLWNRMSLEEGLIAFHDWQFYEMLGFVMVGTDYILIHYFD
jgi:hypothetical protein